MRILVIEDNHRLNSSLASSLTHEGYSVDSAYDGQEGQDLAEMTPYDLILLDILLPVKDGLEVCRDLRRRRVHTPILLLTARDSVDDRVRGLDCGADDYLVKPFAMRELSVAEQAGVNHDDPLDIFSNYPSPLDNRLSSCHGFFHSSEKREAISPCARYFPSCR